VNDEDHDGADLTPMMRALLQAANCFISPAPIPDLLLLAPLQPRTRTHGQAARAALIRDGWLTAPTPGTVALTAQGRAFLASRHSDEPIQVMVVQALSITVDALAKAQDIATLQIVAPQLSALEGCMATAQRSLHAGADAGDGQPAPGLRPAGAGPALCGARQRADVCPRPRPGTEAPVVALVCGHSGPCHCRYE
jgi:hypothetical protein